METVPQDDGTLVARAKNGDFAAFDELVTRHERRLYALALQIVRRREDAEDVVQTAFISALENLDGFREEASFATWITRITTHAALKVLRRRKTVEETALEEESDEDLDVIPHPEYIADWREEPARTYARSELRTILEDAIDALPENYRLVFLLRDVAEMSVRETASLLGISEGNVKVRLLRARLALREILTRRFGDEARRLDHPGHGDGAATSAEALLRSYTE